MIIVWRKRIYAVSLHTESQGEFPHQRSRHSMVVNSNDVARASFLSGGKERDCTPRVCMSEGVLDVKGEVKVTASTRRNKHPKETFSSVRLFESNGLKRLGFSPWMVGYSQELSLRRSAFCSGALLGKMIDR